MSNRLLSVVLGKALGVLTETKLLSATCCFRDNTPGLWGSAQIWHGASLAGGRGHRTFLRLCAACQPQRMRVEAGTIQAINPNNVEGPSRWPLLVTQNTGVSLLKEALRSQDQQPCRFSRALSETITPQRRMDRVVGILPESIHR